MSPSVTLFFYGTLRAAEIRRAVLGTDLPPAQLLDASVSGYQVRRVEGAFYPMLVAAAGGRVDGLVATGLDRRSVDRLDRFEGVHYNRSSLEVLTANGPLAADVYLPDKHMSAAELWDFDSWYKHDMTSFLSQEFHPEGVRPPTN